MRVMSEVSAEWTRWRVNAIERRISAKEFVVDAGKGFWIPYAWFYILGWVGRVQ